MRHHIVFRRRQHSKHQRGKAMCKRLENGEQRAKIYPRMRYAIYARDRQTCLYCGQKVIMGIHHSVDNRAATIEHIQTWTSGGSDEPRNLMCACAHCNFSRQDMALKDFCLREGYDFEEIKREIRRRQRRKIDFQESLKLRRRIKDEKNS